ncbi:MULTISPECIES: hypothetical protein [Leptolyngbya]|nr:MULTISPECIES: hypothetical protein [Leptolyngbya]
MKNTIAIGSVRERFGELLSKLAASTRCIVHPPRTGIRGGIESE